MTTLNSPFGIAVAKQATTISQAGVPGAGGDVKDAVAVPKKDGSSTTSSTSGVAQKNT